MDNAQLYLSLVRPSMIPVVGESSDDLFIKQIEVTGWKWGFHNLKEQREAEKRREKVGRRASFLEKSSKSRGMEESLKRFEASHSATKVQDEIAKLKKELLTASDTKEILDSLTSLEKQVKSDRVQLEKDIAGLWQDNDTAEEVKRSREKDDERARRERDERHQRSVDEKQFEIDLENQKFQFSFSKRIDLATTQMLNSMKAGDVFPLAIFTMHQYSANNPMSLVIKIEGLRLLKYGFAVDASDTMTDLKEEWSCDFKMFSYVYQNRRSFAKPSVGSASDAKQLAAKAATQGTVRTFIMLPKKL
jgi:type VI protein secretion system component Hcp